MKLEGLKKLVKEELAKALNEKLIPKKMVILDLLKSANIPNEAFSPQDKSAAENFIERSNPSEFYLNKIVDILNAYDVDTSSIYAPEPESKPLDLTKISRDIDPYSMPGGRPSRGYMGARYTGD
jgi:hypothetical protein